MADVRVLPDQPALQDQAYPVKMQSVWWSCLFVWSTYVTKAVEPAIWKSVSVE